MDRIPILIKIARMYHEQGIRQADIAERLRISQSRVSRSLKEATRLGLVRTVVVPPPGFHPELEEGVRDRFGLADVVVAQSSFVDEREMLPALGSAAAAYLETVIQAGDRIGISSWSSSLIATVNAMGPLHSTKAEQVVQLIGGVGDPTAQMQATRLAERLAMRTGATPMLLSAPGIVASSSVRDAFLADPYIEATTGAWSDLSLVLVGIGSLQPSPLLQQSGNAIPEPVLEELRAHEAVGDICLRFFDEDGTIVDAGIDSRVLGISVDQLLAVPRRVGVAGGARKYDAIRAALRGGWLDVLVTDALTAERLIADR
jgi:DNA-binding transcriptional regulator LsrR (DeoR family)